MWEHLSMNSQEDPEARIRELERSLSDAARASEKGAPKGGGYQNYPPGTRPVTYSPSFPSSTRTTARFRGLWILAVVFIVFGVVVPALVAGAIFLSEMRTAVRGSNTSSPSSSPTRVTTSTSATITITQANPSLQRLYRVVPQGYGPSNCAPASDPNPQALATVECEQTPDPRSPTSARFEIFPNAGALADAFQSSVDDEAITQCPGKIQSPSSWHTDAAPGVPAGSLLCGTYNDAPDLLWTKNDGLLLGDIQGSDLNSLYQFWRRF